MQYRVTTVINWVKSILENYKVMIDWDDAWDFDWDSFNYDDIKIDIREHRRYNFCKDLNLDHDNIDYWELEKTYYVFDLDFFEHSSIAFSLAINRVDLGYYNMDRSTNIWIIAVPRELAENEKQARELAEKEIENYNSWMNWYIYCYTVLEKTIYTNEKDWNKKIEFEPIDSCWGYISFEDAKSDAISYLDYVLKENNIEHGELDIEEI